VSDCWTESHLAYICSERNRGTQPTQCCSELRSVSVTCASTRTTIPVELSTLTHSKSSTAGLTGFLYQYTSDKWDEWLKRFTLQTKTNTCRFTTIYWVSEQKTGFLTQLFGNKATDAFKGEPSYKPSSKGRK